MAGVVAKCLSVIHIPTDPFILVITVDAVFPCSQVSLAWPDRILDYPFGYFKRLGGEV